MRQVMVCVTALAVMTVAQTLPVRLFGGGAESR